MSPTLIYRLQNLIHYQKWTGKWYEEQSQIIEADHSSDVVIAIVIVTITATGECAGSSGYGKTEIWRKTKEAEVRITKEERRDQK